MRVEPKSFFSNERLLLDWIHVSVILAALVSIGPGNFYFQAIMTPLPAIVLGWGCWKFLKRRQKMMAKEAEGYEGALGAILMVSVVVFISLGFLLC